VVQSGFFGSPGRFANRWDAPEQRRSRVPTPISGAVFGGVPPQPGTALGSFGGFMREQRIAALAQETGLPERTAEWLIEQESQGPKAIRRALGLRSQNFAKILEQEGVIPSAADAAGVPLGELIAQSGEIREDPLNRALRAANQRLYSQQGDTFLDEAGYERSLETGSIVDRGIADPAERPISAATLSADELAALMPDSPAAARLPYGARAMTQAETRDAFEGSGASRTRGGQRNPLAKEPNVGFKEKPREIYPGTTTLQNPSSRSADPDERYAWFTPGSVLGGNLEPDPARAAIPLLIAPRSQERFDQIGQFRAPSVYLGPSEKFVPGLADARILDVNPLAQLSPRAAEALSAELGDDFYTMEEPDKVVTGGYAGRATNVPVPDPATGGGGFDPIYDPAAGTVSATSGRRPMTVAEAVTRIARRNLAPITPVMADQLVGDGQVEVRTPLVDGGMALLRRDGFIGEQPLIEAGLARRPSRPGPASLIDVYPLGISPPEERGLSPAERLTLRAIDSGQRFADARIGSPGRYRPELYGELDTLVGLLAAEAFPNERARFQIHGTAYDPQTRAVNEVRDRFDPMVIERPVGKDWSLLVNSAGRDPLISRYQNQLLSASGMEATGDSNPLLSLVDNLKSLAGVPIPDRAITPASSAAQRVVPGGSELENALRLAKRKANQAARSGLVPAENGSTMFAPDTNAFTRRNYETSARAVLAGALDGRIPLAAAQQRSSGPIPPRDEPRQSPPNEFWKTWRPQSFENAPAPPQAGPTAPRVGPEYKETIKTLVTKYGFNPDEVAQPGTSARRILRQSGQMSLPVSDLGGQYTPSYIDEVAEYMARRAASMPRTGVRNVSIEQGEFFPALRVNPSTSAYGRGQVEPSIRPLGKDELPATQQQLARLGLLAQLRSRNRVF